MLNLIYAEIYKLKKSLSVKICLLLSCVSAAALILISHSIAIGNMSINTSGSASGLTEIMIVSLLGSLMGGILVCNDFETKTIHDAITSGKGRIAIVLSKLIIFVLVIGLLLLPYVIATIIGFLTGAEFSKPFVASVFIGILYDQSGNHVTASEIGKILSISIITLFVHAARLSICIPFAFKIRKSVAVMAVGFAFSAVVDLLFGLLKDIPVIGDIFSFTPFNSEFLILSTSTDSATLLKALVFSIVFLAIILIFTYRIFRRAEIK